MQTEASTVRVAIACGGTGGHLFPGLAVAEQLRLRGCAVTVLISPKEIDQKAVQSAQGVAVATLPAVGLTRGGALAFGRGFVKAYRAAGKLFRTATPEAVLAMGGFTSAPPVLAGRMLHAATFLHESNTVPGRANRWLSWVVDQAFVGFADAGSRLHTRRLKVTGTPVRAEFQATSTSEGRAACRKALGLNADRPVLLVTGGSQGARGLNDLVIQALPTLARLVPGLQLFHLTGPQDGEKVAAACAANGIKAVVRPFFAEMHLALGAATAAISRAGASSLAEMAATQVPAILVPFPAATDNHQFFNAQAFEKSGAAHLLPQSGANAERLAATIARLCNDASAHRQMQAALAHWHAPGAAGEIADQMMAVMAARRRSVGKLQLPPVAGIHNHQSVNP